jgi:hypothetical protein
MAPVTEIAYLTLKPGVELTGSSTSAQVWTDTVKTITQQSGYQRLHWGITLENQSLLMLLIGTYSPANSHHRFPRLQIPHMPQKLKQK